MKINELLKRVNTPLFFDYQIERLFPRETKHRINVQLARFARAGILVRLKRGLYQFSHSTVDELVLANFLYRPSYVSLESALNYHGIIPDVVGNVTSVSPVTSKTLKTARGVFIYSKIVTDLYFGWQTVKDSRSEFWFSVAEPEKAILDYVYIRKIRDLTDQRVDLETLDRRKLAKFGRMFPAWVMRSINEQYHK